MFLIMTMLIIEQYINREYHETLMCFFNSINIIDCADISIERVTFQNLWLLKWQKINNNELRLHRLKVSGSEALGGRVRAKFKMKLYTPN